MILIIGKTPPPYGGVTIYIDRLLEKLSNSDLIHQFLKLKLSNLVKSLFILRRYKIVHIIVSNPLIRVYYGILCKILNRHLIITYPDNIGEFSTSLYNSANRLSIKLATTPLVLNKGSLEVGQNININTKLISSFIPPKTNDDGIAALRRHLGNFLDKHEYIFCTNAFSYCIDKSGNEMYGILSLISIFKNIPNYGLIISDPSGTYADFIIKNKIVLGSNIKLLSVSEFSFFDIIKLSHCLIRATTTDGDSLSIYEAIYLNKNVICSDCVSRPVGCLLYPTNDDSSLFNMIKNYKPTIADFKQLDNQNGFTQILQIYHELMM